VTQPNILRLIQHLALQPAPTTPAAAAPAYAQGGPSQGLLVVSNNALAQVCGAVSDMQVQQWFRRWALDSVGVDSRAFYHDQSHVEGRFAQQMAPVIGNEVRLPMLHLQFLCQSCVPDDSFMLVPGEHAMAVLLLWWWLVRWQL
jgi:hypothetical protein